MLTTDQHKISFRYVAILLLAVCLSWFVHELSHYLTGVALGYRMTMTLNTASPLDGKYIYDWHYQLISAAGPLITIAEALIVFVLMKQAKRKFLYPFLFTCFYLRLLAALLSFINPNDEARISKAAGLGTFTLPLLVVALLFYLLYQTSKRYHFSKTFNAANLGLIILFSSVIILSDQYFRIRIL